jgi:DNA gyrase subunit A
VSENGYGKLTKTSNFPAHKRGGVGIKSAIVTAKTGKIITVRSIDPLASEILIISSQGQTIRVGLADIPTLGRTTQGVRIMRLKDNDSVASLGIIVEQPGDENEKDE